MQIRVWASSKHARPHPAIVPAAYMVSHSEEITVRRTIPDFLRSAARTSLKAQATRPDLAGGVRRISVDEDTVLNTGGLGGWFV